MIENFVVKNPDNVSVGTVSYNHDTKEWFASVAEDYKLLSGPLMFDVWYKRGYNPTAEETLMFIRNRVCPPERQNIGEILYHIGAKEYSEYVLIIANEGRCVMDNCRFERVVAE